MPAGLFNCHRGVCYSAIWSPHSPNLLATVGGDGLLNIIDTGTGRVAQGFVVHNGQEVPQAVHGRVLAECANSSCRSCKLRKSRP